jgi:outer membrane beta-barrel protein
MREVRVGSSIRKTALLALGVCLAAAFAPAVAAADDVLAGSDSVRRALLYRASRHEIAGLVGTTLGDPYIRNILPGARYDFHLYDWLSFGGRLQVGIPVETTTYNEVDVKVTRNNETFVMEASSIRMLGLAHVSVSPLVGKLMVLNGGSVHFDIHFDLMAGLAAIGSTGDALTTGAGPSFGAGGGFRVFFSDIVALTAGLEALTTNRALSVNRDSKEEGQKVRFNTVLNVGLSFFMPPKMKRGK